MFFFDTSVPLLWHAQTHTLGFFVIWDQRACPIPQEWSHSFSPVLLSVFVCSPGCGQGMKGKSCPEFKITCILSKRSYLPGKSRFGKLARLSDIRGGICSLGHAQPVNMENLIKIILTQCFNSEMKSTASVLLLLLSKALTAQS